MDYPGVYRAQVLSVVTSIDLSKVGEAIQIFKNARADGRRIFVCGYGLAGTMAAQSLCEIVKGASSNPSARFRILALSNEMARTGQAQDRAVDDRVFVEQVKNFAEPDDVVVGICAFGTARVVVNAMEYASWIGCKTIAITGSDSGRLGELSDLVVAIPATHLGSIEAAEVIICQMIGYYFTDFEKP